MKKTKKVLALTMAAGMIFSLTACSASKPPEGTGTGAQTTEGKTETGSKDGKREKIVISTYLADAAQVAVREKYIDEPLKAAFPDVDIEIKMYNDRQSLQVEVAGGGGPDILDLDGPTDVAEFAKADRVLTLDDFAAKYGWQDMFYDWAYDSCFYNGKLYSLPTSFEGMVLYYNMDVMQKNGFEVPKTKDELVALMKEMKEKGIIPISFGNSNYQGAVDWLYSTFTSCYAGPDAMRSALTGEGKFTDPKITASIQTMTDWWNEGWLGDKASQSITNEDMLAFFAEGRAGMMIDGTWAANQLNTTYPDCNWDSEMMPEDPEIGYVLPFATGGGYSINANSKNPELAAEVLNFLFTSLDRHYTSITEAGYQPYPLKAFDISKISGMDPKMYDQYKLLMDAQANKQIGFCSWTFYPSDMRVYMNENVDSVFLGVLSVDDFMKNAQQYLDKALESGAAPVLPSK